MSKTNIAERLSGGLPAHLMTPKGMTLEDMGSFAAFRAATLLPKDAQEIIDKAVIQVGLNRLVIAGDWMAEGLTTPLANPLSVTQLTHHKESKAGHAQRTMVPDARNENQKTDLTPVTVPIYATMDDFSINVRELLMAQRTGHPLELTRVTQATRRVNESIEDATINGAGITVAGNTTPGLLNAPNVNTVTFDEAWTDAAHSGQDIIDDVLAMIDEAQADNRFGPYNLYINTTYGNELNKNFGDGVTTFDKTILQRIEEIVAGGRGIRVRVADQLPTDRTIFMEMSKEVADIVTGQAPTVVSWQTAPGWIFNFTVMAFMIPRVFDDFDGQSGIVTGNV